MSFYKFARIIVKIILTPLYRIETIGLENVPKEGGVLLCANHKSNLDPPVIGITMKRPVIFMAKAELFNIPVLNTIMRTCHAFPIKRGKADRVALRKGLETLRDGHVLGIFPEGKRSKTGELGKGMSGVGFFALKTNAYVVPCGIIGTYKPFRKTKVVYGKPIPFDELRNKKTSADEATELIMSHIKEILLQYK